jgi:uncharacterized protein YbjQ (UPF0145 family)
MLTTTTHQIQGKKITEYKGLVFGESILGANFFKDFSASIRDVVGGRSTSYEGVLVKARESAQSEMIQRAISMGANAIIGITFDFETLGSKNGMMMLTCCGTAVYFKDDIN